MANASRAWRKCDGAHMLPSPAHEKIRTGLVPRSILLGAFAFARYFMKLDPLIRHAAVFAVCGLAGLAAAQSAPPIVGEATLVIGVARVFGGDGATRAVERGTAIRVGDRVETEAGGHVHFRFVDGGRLSIRPSSRLQIESYNHSSQEPALTAIKFRLDEGVVRSITGAWGEGARDRFRLNTPVAAIGVKGTDFVVKSEPEKTSASVYTGAIVLSPLTPSCVATLGPCQSGREKLLSDDMKGQMLELGRQQSSPQLVPLVDLLAQGRRMAPSETMRAEKAGAPDPARQELVSGDKAVVTEVRSADVVAAGSVPPPVIPPPVITPPVLTPPVVTQLVWGRWLWTPEGDGLSSSFQEASKGRHGTIGSASFGLFRSAPDANALMQTSEASANFRLSGGSGLLLAPYRPTETVLVESGSLNVDFSRATFATQLNVSNPSIGANTLQASGIVQPNGHMLGQGGNAYVAGALSLDAKEAGYFFEKAFPAGHLSGITLWGR